MIIINNTGYGMKIINTSPDIPDLSPDEIQSYLDLYNATHDFKVFPKVNGRQAVNFLYPDYAPGYREAEVQAIRDLHADFFRKKSVQPDPPVL